ncbi:unnamed protein product [Pleuronectes platessa]|uniref:Uncharacterized protein n=1 Tax=Pleuronectes platessa TaxID=8262 RepID=A0A9N7Y212_PLEPL|nr:unnamed protein product [Pleuronectes platessa]
MAPASASFQSATKALERMKDESRLNTSHGNGAGLRCGEGRNLFEALDQSPCSGGHMSWQLHLAEYAAQVKSQDTQTSQALTRIFNPQVSTSWMKDQSPHRSSAIPSIPSEKPSAPDLS